MNYDSDEEPDSHFDRLTSTLNDYKVEFEKDESSHQTICEALTNIEEIIEELRNNYDYGSDDESYTGIDKEQPQLVKDIRSIFDDVHL